MVDCSYVGVKTGKKKGPPYAGSPCIMEEAIVYFLMIFCVVNMLFEFALT